MRVSVKITDKNPDVIRELVKRCKGASEAYVTVGVHEDAGEYEGDGAPSVVEVALWNEFGTHSIPSRPFLRTAIDENVAKINAWRVEAARKIVFGGWTVEKGLEMIGFRVQQLIQNKIRSDVPPPNAPSTAADKVRRGVAPNTLMDSTLLLRSVTYKVHKGG